MPLRDVLRWARDEVIPLERARRSNPLAVIASGVRFAGNPTDLTLGVSCFVQGPTSLVVTNGGGLSAASLEVGDRTYIGEFNNIRCAGAPIKIGSDCLISQHITIVGSNHGTAPGQRIVDQAWVGTGVKIGNDVWIGAGAVVLPGSIIGDGAVVAANSVVRGVIEPGDVVGGTPANRITRR